VALSMGERKAVTRELAARYRSAPKKRRGEILDELCALTGWHRDHARKALRTVATAPAVRRGAPKPVKAVRRPRAVVYGPEVFAVITKVWAVLDAPCGKRLKAALPLTLAALEAHGELRLEPALKARVLAVSASTLDRRLAPERARMGLKGRSGTRPGSMLKTQIPIRTFAGWTRPGRGSPSWTWSGTRVATRGGTSPRH
jgi:hypothetical protein